MRPPHGFDRPLSDCQGMWLSGRAFASHVKGPGFNPRHLQFDTRRWCSGIMQDSHSCDPGSIPGRRTCFHLNVLREHCKLHADHPTTRAASGSRLHRTASSKKQSMKRASMQDYPRCSTHQSVHLMKMVTATKIAKHISCLIKLCDIV